MSLHLEGVVIMMESFLVHSVSHLVSMVSFMYVTMVTAEFRYSSFVLSTLFTIMIMTSFVMIMITSYQYNMCKQKRSHCGLSSKCHCTPHCSSVIVTCIVHYIMTTSHPYKNIHSLRASDSIRALRNYFNWYLEICG